MTARKKRSKKTKGEEPRAFIYRDVAQKLREGILSGEYPPSSKLPSLHDLIEEFNVSTISIRRAIAELTNEGLIFGEQGRGVFVRPKGVIHRILPVSSRSSTGDEIARAGFKPRIQELKRDRIVPPEDVANRLSLPPRTKINRHQKMVFSDEQPVSFHILYYPDEIAERLSPNLDKMFVFRLLHHAKIRFAKTHFEFGAGALTSEHVELFDLSVGYPMGLVYFTPQTKGGRPILSGTTIYRSDRFLYEITAPLMTG